MSRKHVDQYKTLVGKRRKAHVARSVDLVKSWRQGEISAEQAMLLMWESQVSNCIVPAPDGFRNG